MRYWKRLTESMARLHRWRLDNKDEAEGLGNEREAKEVESGDVVWRGRTRE